VKFDGPCSKCGTTLVAGEPAVWDRATRKMSCIECPIDSGEAGASARHEYERRLAKREAANKERWGERVGGWVNRFGDVPQSTRAWGVGARGEEFLGGAFAAVLDIVALHDRRVPGTRGNIDHIVIGPAGVFVVDAKLYKGVIRIRDRGGFFRRDDRLYVGRRDCSKLVDGIERQVAAVRAALESVDAGDIPVTPVLCFIDGEWPLLFPPTSFRGVRLAGGRSIKAMVNSGTILGPDEVARLAGVLASALPPMRIRGGG
jgi:hypothetical protein